MIETLRCQSCGTTLSKKEEFKTGFYECSACGSINIVNPSFEDKQEKPFHERCQNCHKLFDNSDRYISRLGSTHWVCSRCGTWDYPDSEKKNKIENSDIFKDVLKALSNRSQNDGQKIKTNLEYYKKCKSKRRAGYWALIGLISASWVVLSIAFDTSIMSLHRTASLYAVLLYYPIMPFGLFGVVCCIYTGYRGNAVGWFGLIFVLLFILLRMLCWYV